VAGRIVSTVYAADIDPLMVTATRERATEADGENATAETRDFLAEGVDFAKLIEFCVSVALRE
jgi:hypothetical protein